MGKQIRFDDAARVVGALASDLRLQDDSPIREFGRARHLTGFDLPFESYNFV